MNFNGRCRAHGCNGATARSSARQQQFAISATGLSMNAQSMQSISSQCREIRERLRREHLGGGLLFLTSGEQITRNGDVYHQFRASSDWLYITQLNEPSYSLLFDADDSQLTLFAPQKPPEAAFWMGPQPSLEQIAEVHGADRVQYSEDLAASLRAAKGKMVHTTEGSLSTIKKVLGTNSDTKVVSGLLDKTLARCRAVKTSAEIECLLDANKISGKAHQAVWKGAKPDIFEFQCESIFRSTCMNSGYATLGYPCIVGAGTNSSILHYETNRMRAKDGDLILIDAGAESRNYTADITRTFPVSGRFNSAQAEVYDAVLAVQEEALGSLKAGVLLSHIALGARTKLLECLIQIGLVKKSISLEHLLSKNVDRTFMPHGLSHLLGLDVHDMGDEGPVPKLQRLRDGNVITVEPGIYFIEPLLLKANQEPEVSKCIDWERLRVFESFGGVRIEDNVVITKDGIRNLTVEAMVPKRRQEIEEVMRA
jgi:Xaa-Pro dipeptidase